MDEETYEAARPVLSAGSNDADGATNGNSGDEAAPAGDGSNATTEGTGFTEEPAVDAGN